MSLGEVISAICLYCGKHGIFDDGVSMECTVDNIEVIEDYSDICITFRDGNTPDLHINLNGEKVK